MPGRAPKTKAALVSLADVLALYADGTVTTKMVSEDVSTAIFSMPGTTTVRDALQAMIHRRHRRIFISGKKEEEDSSLYVSDRSMMSYLFSPSILEVLGREEERRQRDLLSTPISKVEKVVPSAIGPRATLKSAALRLRKDRGGCLVTGEGKVVTPWDVVMKPWMSNRLVIDGGNSRR